MAKRTVVKPKVVSKPVVTKVDKKNGGQRMWAHRLLIIALGVPLIACIYLLINHHEHYQPLEFVHVGEADADLQSRVIFGLKSCSVCAIPLLFGIIVVALHRFSSSQLDPLSANKPSRRFLANSRFVSNTTEQLLLMVIGVMAACVTPEIDLRVITICVALFLVGRVLFYIGYHMPVSTFKSPGMVMTFAATIPLIVLSAFFFIEGEAVHIYHHFVDKASVAAQETIQNFQ